MHLRGGLLYLFFIFPHPWVEGSVAEYTPLRFYIKKIIFKTKIKSKYTSSLLPIHNNIDIYKYKKM